MNHIRRLLLHFCFSIGTIISTVPLLPIVTFVATLLPAPARGVTDLPPWRWNRGSFGLSATTEYFMTKGNYDAKRGSFTRLPGDNSFTTFESTVRARYGFTPRLSTYAGLGFAQVRAVDSFNERTNAAVTDVFVGADFMIATKWIRLVPEIQAGYPMDKVSVTTTNPLTSDGVAYARTNAFFLIPTRWLNLQGRLGLHLPAEGLAKRLLYDIGAEIPIGRRFAIGGGIEGYETILSDELSAAERQAVTAIADAGSQRFYAYNPALLEGRGWIRFTPDRTTQIRVGYSKTLNGIRTAEGQALTMSVAFNLPGKKKSSIDSGTLSDLRRGAPTLSGPEEAARKFEIEVEKMDPDLLPPDDPIDQQNTDILNDTEKLLEKRGKGKKANE